MALRDVAVVPEMHPAVAPTWYAVEFGKANLLKGIEGLTDEQLFQVPPGFRNSIATLLCHIAGTEVGFAYGLSGRKLPDELKTEYFLGRKDGLLIEPTGETKQSLLAKFEKGRTILKEALRQVSPEDLDKTFDLNPDTQVTMRWYLTVIGFHFATHTGHIQLLLQNVSK